MNLLNVASGQTALNATLSSLRSASQSVANLFNSRVPTSFGTTLQELEESQNGSQAAGLSAAARQNIVATLSNSRAEVESASTEENASGLAAIFGNGVATADVVSNSTGAATTIGGAASQTTTSTAQPVAAPAPYAPPKPIAPILASTGPRITRSK